jgi:hypothetical protein
MTTEPAGGQQHGRHEQAAEAEDAAHAQPAQTVLVVIHTTCQATVTESWVLRLTPQQLTALGADPTAAFHEVIDPRQVVSVENVEVEDVENRELHDWRRLGPGGPCDECLALLPGGPCDECRALIPDPTT